MIDYRKRLDIMKKIIDKQTQIINRQHSTLELVNSALPRFNIGQEVWAVQSKRNLDPYEVVGPLTIGMFNMIIVNSKGVEGQEAFDNYCAQQYRSVVYMCNETGIGSGLVYKEEDLKGTKEEAEQWARGLTSGEEIEVLQ